MYSEKKAACNDVTNQTMRSTDKHNKALKV